MSRRSQSRRRRSYGRRQHEARERRQQPSSELLETPLDADWSASDISDGAGRNEAGPYSSFTR